MIKFVASRIAIALVVLTPLAANAQAIKGAATPQAAVEEFMRALADSNLTRMADRFGTTSGPWSKTRPKGYEKQLIIMQAFLRGVHAKALGDVAASKGSMRTVTTQLSNNGCSVTIPINVLKYKDAWLVHDYDQVEGRKINQPCEQSGRPGN
jgi:hypothetical protein